VVRINRCATVVKGGRRFSFSGLVVVGDENGRVGVGYGKAKGVPDAVEKAAREARTSMVKINVVDGTIPHEVVGIYGSAKIVLMPASPGTGVIAGATVRSVVEGVGIKNILTKSLGSPNPVNLVKATIAGLRSLRTRESVERLRGVQLSKVAGTWKNKQASGQKTRVVVTDAPAGEKQS
jgi:small subunit ribosomal protein S5